MIAVADTLLKHLKGIVIYEIYTRRTKIMNEVAKSRYDEAMLWLEKVSEGKIKPPLPIRAVDTDGDGTPDTPTTFLKLGSNKKYQKCGTCIRHFVYTCLKSRKSVAECCLCRNSRTGGRIPSRQRGKNFSYDRK